MMVIELLNGNAYVIDSKTLLRLTKAWFKEDDFLEQDEMNQQSQEGRRI